LQDEVCAELSLDSMFFGVPAEEEHRVATLKDHDPLPPDYVGPTAYLRELRATPEFNLPEVRQACLPAHGGIMNARSLATHYAMLLGGGEWRGVRLLMSERVRITTQPAYEGEDLITGLRVRRGLGYSLGGSGLGAIGDRPAAFGHSGVGGTMAFGDPDSGIAFALTKNYLAPATLDDDVATLVHRELRGALGLSD
jgi:CubicO group peptidase (beta-lactamase class C family)